MPNKKYPVLVEIADCLKGISKDDLTTAEKKIAAVLIREKVIEYNTFGAVSVGVTVDGREKK